MPFAFMFIKQYWLYIVIAIVVALGVGYVSSLKVTIAHQQTRITELEAENKQLVTANDMLAAANKDLTTSLNKQTAAVDKWVAEANERQQAAKAAIAKAKAERQKWEKKYKDLLSAPPAIPGDDCGSLNILLDQYISTRRGEP